MKCAPVNSTLAEEIMNTRDISRILIKISGALIIILSINDLAYLANSYIQYQTENLKILILGVIFPVLVQILAGTALFANAERLTTLFSKNDYPQEHSENDIDLLQLEQIILSAIGIFVIYRASTDILYHIIAFVQAMYSWPMEVEKPTKSFLYTPGFLTTIAEFIFGLMLILSTKPLSKFLNKLRKEK